MAQEQHLTGPRFHLRIPSSGLRLMLTPCFPRNHSRWASECGISESHYTRVFSIECPRVNSNYTFLLDCSQPEMGKKSYGWLTTIPRTCTRVHKHTGWSQVWLRNFPLRAGCQFCRLVECTNHTPHTHTPLGTINCLPCSHFSFLVEYSQKTSHQTCGKQAIPP